MGKEVPWDCAEKWCCRNSGQGSCQAQGASRVVLRCYFPFCLNLGYRKLKLGLDVSFPVVQDDILSKWNAWAGQVKQGWLQSESRHCRPHLFWCLKLVGAKAALHPSKQMCCLYGNGWSSWSPLQKAATGQPELVAELCVGSGISLRTDVANTGVNLPSAVTASVR